MKLREYIVGYETSDNKKLTVIEYTHIQDAMYHALQWDTIYATTSHKAKEIFEAQQNLILSKSLTR